MLRRFYSTEITQEYLNNLLTKAKAAVEEARNLKRLNNKNTAARLAGNNNRNNEQAQYKKYKKQQQQQQQRTTRQPNIGLTSRSSAVNPLTKDVDMVDLLDVDSKPLQRNNNSYSNKTRSTKKTHSNRRLTRDKQQNEKNAYTSAYSKREERPAKSTIFEIDPPTLKPLLQHSNGLTFNNNTRLITYAIQVLKENHFPLYTDPHILKPGYASEPDAHFIPGKSIRRLNLQREPLLKNLTIESDQDKFNHMVRGVYQPDIKPENDKDSWLLLNIQNCHGLTMDQKNFLYNFCKDAMN